MAERHNSNISTLGDILKSSEKTCHIYICSITLTKKLKKLVGLKMRTVTWNRFPIQNICWTSSPYLSPWNCSWKKELGKNIFSQTWSSPLKVQMRHRGTRKPLSKTYQCRPSSGCIYKWQEMRTSTNSRATSAVAITASGQLRRDLKVLS